MREDPRVFCIGEDIAEFGGAFKATKGLLEEFGAERVIDTPIAESGIAALAIGAAMSGLRPILEMQFADFVSNAFTQIVYNAAKSHYRWGQAVPLVIRLPAGGGLSAGPFHSSNPEAWFMNIPGLKIVAPATVKDARALLKAAAYDNNPVLFLEHKYLYRRLKDVLGEEESCAVIGEARIARSGTDASIVTFGAMVLHAVEAAGILAKEGFEVEVIDLRSILPWDKQTVLESVKKTSRCLVLYEANYTGGVGGEYASYISEFAFRHLDAPVTRLASKDTPVPFAPALEKAFLPGVDDIVSAVRGLLAY